MSFGGGSGGGGGTISTSGDVALSNPTNNDVLTYNGSTAKWQNQTPSAGAVTYATLPAGTTS